MFPGYYIHSDIIECSNLIQFAAVLSTVKGWGVIVGGITCRSGRMVQLLRRETSCFEPSRSGFTDLGSIPG